MAIWNVGDDDDEDDDTGTNIGISRQVTFSGDSMSEYQQKDKPKGENLQL